MVAVNFVWIFCFVILSLVLIPVLPSITVYSNFISSFKVYKRLIKKVAKAEADFTFQTLITNLFFSPVPIINSLIYISNDQRFKKSTEPKSSI